MRGILFGLWMTIGRAVAWLFLVFGILGIGFQGFFLILRWFTGRPIQLGEGMEVSLYRLGVAIVFAVVGFLALRWEPKRLKELDL